LKITDSFALGYMLAAVWTFFLASVFVLYKVWVYERSLREADECIRRMSKERSAVMNEYLTTAREIHKMLERVLGGDTRHLESRAAELAVEDFELYWKISGDFEG
jgi:hypothetical protein